MGEHHQMTRYIVVLAGVLGGAAPAWAGAADLFPEKVKDFGVSARGTILVHYFRFTNTTGQQIQLGQPRVSCGCVSAYILKNQIAPGETTAVIAQMDTRRIPTPGVTKSVTVYVPFFSPTVEEVSLRVQTVCRDDLIMSADTLAFGTVPKGKGAKASAKVTLTTDPSWQVTAAQSTGGYVKVEAKQDSRQGSQVTYEVTATLDKDCPAGNWTSEVFLTTNNPGIPKLRIPVTVNVTNQVASTAEVGSTGPVNEKVTTNR
jgi:hypothetical protein